jgi:uncharacterized Zn finger protein (UPF0148 family)
MNINVCEQCGNVFDSTGYPVCPDCQFDHIFIRIPNEEANNESRQDGKGRQSNERI